MIKMLQIDDNLQPDGLGPFFLLWFSFNPGMDKLSLVQ